jgi:DNA-binding NarL/FixJ family response regulator
MVNRIATFSRDAPEIHRGLDAMADVVALIDDLFFQVKVIETAKHLGIGLRVCGTPEALLSEIAKQSPGLIVIDLNARSNPLAAIEALPPAARGIPVVAFLSHVQTDLAEKARAAGCREVMPRSVFTRDLATILARAKSHSS